MWTCIRCSREGDGILVLCLGIGPKSIDFYEDCLEFLLEVFETETKNREESFVIGVFL